VGAPAKTKGPEGDVTSNVRLDQTTPSPDGRGFKRIGSLHFFLLSFRPNFGCIKPSAVLKLLPLSKMRFWVSAYTFVTNYRCGSLAQDRVEDLNREVASAMEPSTAGRQKGILDARYKAIRLEDRERKALRASTSNASNRDRLWRCTCLDPVT
jgi:hypothetical protein